LDEKDPFIEDEHQVAPRFGYLYKIWNIGVKKRICIRCTVHSYKSKSIISPPDDKPDEKPTVKVVYQNVYTLLEYEPNKSNWKGNLDKQMAQCLMKEVQDNASKVSRWVV
jgi:hypothetical protein